MTTITALPPAPSRADPDTFSDKSDTLLGALDGFVTETNTVAGEVNANAVAAAASASDAADQVTLAAAQVTLAEAQVTLAAAQATAAEGSAIAAGAVVWVSGTTYAIGDCRYSPINLQTYRRKTNGGGITDPSADSTNWGKAIEIGISNIVTATGMTTLTSTPTLLQITPTGYGVAVTLPDATGCSEGGPIHIIDNKGAYPLRVLNSAGTLLGFIFAGVVSHVSLVDNSSAAGTWTIENSELVGASAQLLTTNLNYLGGLNPSVIAIDSSREFIMGYNAANTVIYGVVYNKSTNTFGTVTAIRTVSVNDNKSACLLSATDQILVVSCHTTAFEAVVLSISGTTITVNTAATATLSANISAFAEGCGLIAVGSSFVTSYTVSGPAAQIRALSISGTTVTIGSATVLDGTAGGLIAASSDKVIAVSAATSNFYTKPYTVSGSTLSAGTGTTTAAGSTVSVSECKLAALGTRWFTCYRNATPDVFGGVISLSGTTTTISTATMLASTILQDAIVVGSNKVLVLGSTSSSNANILTDTAGTASAGTAITLSAATTRSCLCIDGTDVYVGEDSTHVNIRRVSCSGASPVLTSSESLGIPGAQAGTALYNYPSNSILRKPPIRVVGAGSCAAVSTGNSTGLYLAKVKSGVASMSARTRICYAANAASYDFHRGKTEGEVWQTDTATVITKIECVQ